MSVSRRDLEGGYVRWPFCGGFLVFNMTSLLAVFKSSKAKDETGKEIEIEPKMEGSLCTGIRGDLVEIYRSIFRRPIAFLLQHHSPECENGHAGFDQSLCLVCTELNLGPGVLLFHSRVYQCVGHTCGI